MNAEQRIEYCQTVWANFTAKRGAPGPSMSSAEFSIIANWARDGVPLAVVLRGIADHKGAMTSRTGLAYIKPAVEESIRYWRKALA